MLLGAVLAFALAAVDDPAPATPPTPPTTPTTTTTDAPSTAQPATPPTSSTLPSTATPSTPPSTPPVTAARVKTIVLDIKGASATKEEADVLSGVVAASLAEFVALDVMSGADVRGIATLEAEKQSLGCDTQSASCLAEIAGALGARLVAFGEVHKLGDVAVLNATLFDTQAQAPVGRLSLQGLNVADIAAALPDSAHDMALRFLDAEHLSTARTTTRRIAPKLPHAASSDDDGAGGFAITGIVGLGIVGVVQGGLLASALTFADSPARFVHASQVPVAGPFLAINEVLGHDVIEGGCFACEGVEPILLGTGLVGTTGAAMALGGGAGWAVTRISHDGELDAAGNAWRWGFVGTGAAVFTTAVIVETSLDQQRAFGAGDVAIETLLAVGVVMPIVGIGFNPFVRAE